MCESFIFIIVLKSSRLEPFFWANRHFGGLLCMELNKVPSICILNESATFFSHFVEEQESLKGSSSPRKIFLNSAGKGILMIFSSTCCFKSISSSSLDGLCCYAEWKIPSFPWVRNFDHISKHSFDLNRFIFVCNIWISKISL